MVHYQILYIYIYVCVCVCVCNVCVSIASVVLVNVFEYVDWDFLCSIRVCRGFERDT